jgi:hypothetical protein
MHHYEGAVGAERLVSLACADGDVCDFTGGDGGAPSDRCSAGMRPPDITGTATSTAGRRLVGLRLMAPVPILTLSLGTVSAMRLLIQVADELGQLGAKLRTGPERPSVGERVVNKILF